MVSYEAEDLGVTYFYGLIDRLGLSLQIRDGGFCFSQFWEDPRKGRELISKQCRVLRS